MRRAGEALDDRQFSFRGRAEETATKHGLIGFVFRDDRDQRVHDADHGLTVSTEPAAQLARRAKGLFIPRPRNISRHVVEVQCHPLQRQSALGVSNDPEHHVLGRLHAVATVPKAVDPLGREFQPTGEIGVTFHHRLRTSPRDDEDVHVSRPRLIGEVTLVALGKVHLGKARVVEEHAEAPVDRAVHKDERDDRIA